MICDTIILVLPSITTGKAQRTPSQALESETCEESLGLSLRRSLANNEKLLHPRQALFTHQTIEIRQVQEITTSLPTPTLMSQGTHLATRYKEIRRFPSSQASTSNSLENTLLELIGTSPL